MSAIKGSHPIMSLGTQTNQGKAIRREIKIWNEKKNKQYVGEGVWDIPLEKNHQRQERRG